MARLPTFPPADLSTQGRYPPLCAGTRKYFSLTKPTNQTEMTGYYTVDWPGIVWRAQNPENTDKENGFWVLPSTYTQRDARLKYTQGEHGQFWILNADVDQGNLDLATVVGGVRQLLDPGTEFLVFATKNSGRVYPEKGYDGEKRWRVMVPTGGAVPGHAYHHLAGVFNEALALVLNVEMDPVTERVNQYLFLANQGVHYEYHVEPGVPWGVAPSTVLAVAMTNKARERIANDPRRNNAVRERKRQRGRYLELFAQRYPLGVLLARYGFTEQPDSNNWHYEGQSTNSYATSIMYDDTWATSSGTVEAITGRRRGDAFDLFVAFEGGGDWNACFKRWCAVVNAEAAEALKHFPFIKGFTCDGEHVFPGIS